MMRTLQSVLEWAVTYWRLRRRQYPTDEAWRKRMRILFKVSSFVRLKGWKTEDLEAALDEVRNDPMPGPPARKPKPEAKVCRQPPRPKVPDEPESPEETERRRRIARALSQGPKLLTCLDCGEPLPSDRKRRGRCDPCRAKRRLISHRHAKRRWRKKRVEGLSISWGHLTPENRLAYFNISQKPTRPPPGLTDGHLSPDEG